MDRCCSTLWHAHLVAWPPARVVLSVAVFGAAALAVGLLARADLRWELWAAALLALLAYHFGYPNLRHQPRPRLRAGGTDRTGNACQHSVEQSRHGAAARRPPLARPLPRPLPEGLPLGYGLTMLDREFRIVWCNDVAAAQFGFDAQGDIGRRIAAVVRHPSLAAYLAAGDFSKSLRMQVIEADETILSVQFVPYVASGWLLLSRNVVRAARLELKRRECIANVSHELRAPLTVLLGYVETLRELGLDARRSRAYLDRMEEQCERMQQVIEEQLQLSALESAAEPLRDERVAIGDMLSRICTEVEALSAGRHRIRVEADKGFDLLGAKGEIASAFGNLASNAVRYTAPGGEVRIVWRASRAGAEFVVEDTGIGIEKEHIPRLTERHYRVNRDSGTGLGLALVKRTLSRHQGALEIESEPGRGSRFTIRFPADRVVAAAA